MNKWQKYEEYVNINKGKYPMGDDGLLYWLDICVRVMLFQSFLRKKTCDVKMMHVFIAVTYYIVR